MILATKNGWMIAVTVLRESTTAVSYCPHDEPGAKTTISKNDPERKMFDNVDDAEAWINKSTKRKGT